MNARKAFATTSAAALMTAGLGLASAPAQAAPLVTGGVVNVTVTEVIDDVTVTVEDVNVGVAAAVGIAANICDTTVAVLSRELRKGSTSCTSDSGQTVTLRQA